MRLFRAYFENGALFVARIMLFLMALIAAIGASHLSEELVMFATFAFAFIAFLILLGFEDFVSWIRTKPTASARLAKEKLDDLRKIAPDPELAEQSLCPKIKELVMEINDTLGQSVTHRDATLRLLDLSDREYYEAATYRAEDMRKAAKWIGSVGRKAIKAHGEMTLLKLGAWLDLPAIIAGLSCLPTRSEEDNIRRHGKHLPGETVAVLHDVVELAKEATDRWLIEQSLVTEGKLTLAELATTRDIDSGVLRSILGDPEAEREKFERKRNEWRALKYLQEENPLLWLLYWNAFLGIQDVRN